jgi:hypothetical protein
LTPYGVSLQCTKLLRAWYNFPSPILKNHVLPGAVIAASCQGAGRLFENAWNGWVEGSNLLPDMLNGFGYLEAVKDVR